MYVFFFQAEDGIRDYDVTGVQTCALPISGQVIDSVHRSIDMNVFADIMFDERKTFSVAPLQFVGDRAPSR